jgi:hypothetical protein
MKLYKEYGFGKRYFQYSGQKRSPKKGEYYLSGAIPQVYQAPNDLSTVFHIMSEVPPPPQTIEKNGLTYRLEA